MERCECLPLNSKFAQKLSLWKQNRSTDKVISINQSFKVLSTGTNACPQPWPHGLVDDAVLELSPDRNWPLLILQGSVATLFRWSWKIVEVMIKKFWCFLCLTVYITPPSGALVHSGVFWRRTTYYVLPCYVRYIHSLQSTGTKISAVAQPLWTLAVLAQLILWYANTFIAKTETNWKSLFTIITVETNKQ